MFKYAGLIIDQSDDPAGRLVKTASEVPLGVLKTASNDPKKLYAMEVLLPNGTKQMKYPLDTPYDAYLSALYFEKVAYDLPAEIVPQVAARIKAALESHGIDTARFNLLTKVASSRVPDEPVKLITKVAKDSPTLREKIAMFKKKAKKLTYRKRKALPDSAFALVIKKDGKKIRKYPLHDEAHVRNAIVRFSQFHHKLPPKYRAIVARKIKQKAKEYGIQLSKDNVINKYAGEEVAPYFWEALEIRKSKTGFPGYNVLEKMASQLEPFEIAERLEMVDKLAGFDRYWDVYGDPYETVLGPYKTASERLTGEDPLKKKKFELYKRIFGEEFAKRLLEDEELEQEVIGRVDLPNL